MALKNTVIMIDQSPKQLQKHIFFQIVAALQSARGHEYFLLYQENLEAIFRFLQRFLTTSVFLTRSRRHTHTHTHTHTIFGSVLWTSFWSSDVFRVAMTMLTIVRQSNSNAEAGGRGGGGFESGQEEV